MNMISIDDLMQCRFLDPEGGSQKAIVLVDLLVVGISSLKILELSSYAAERNETVRTHSR